MKMNPILLAVAMATAALLAPVASAGTISDVLHTAANLNCTENCDQDCPNEDDPAFQATCTVFLIGYGLDDVAAHCVPGYEDGGWDYETCCSDLWNNPPDECKDDRGE